MRKVNLKIDTEGFKTPEQLKSTTAIISNTLNAFIKALAESSDEQEINLSFDGSVMNSPKI